MATKVCIIDVDLGISVDTIISNAILELSKNTQDQLDQTIESAKIVQKVKTEKAYAAQVAQDKMTNYINIAYEELLKSGDAGLPVSSVMSYVVDVITNPIVLVSRMKKFLSDKGNPYYIERKKVHGTPHYVLIKFNGDTPEN